MVRQESRRGRFIAKLHDNQTNNSFIRDFAKVLDPDAFKETTRTFSDAEVAAAHKKAKIIPLSQYKMLLAYITATGEQYHSAYAPPPQQYPILPPVAQLPFQYSAADDRRTYSVIGSHEANSHLEFYIPGSTTNAKATGFIETIWEMPLNNVDRYFFLIRAHRSLPDSQVARTPYHHFPCTLLRAHVVDAASSNMVYIIEPHHIIAHLTAYKRRKGTFNIARDTMVICWGLNRGRR